MAVKQQARHLILLLVAIGTVFSFIARARQASQKPGGNSDTAVAGKKGESLFQQNCVKCHGADGKGLTAAGEIAGAPDFTDWKWQRKLGDSKMRQAITHGTGQMPAFGQKLSKAEIALLARYVRAFKARDPR